MCMLLQYLLLSCIIALALNSLYAWHCTAACIPLMIEEHSIHSLLSNHYIYIVMHSHCTVQSRSLLHKLSNNGSVCYSVHKQFQQCYSNVFVVSRLITAPTHFNVLCSNCVESSVEPWQVWWVTASAATETAHTIPERVPSEPNRPKRVKWAIAVEVLSNKGWRLYGKATWVAKTSAIVTSSISPQVVSRCTISDGEPIDVGIVNGSSGCSINTVTTVEHVPNGPPANMSEAEAQCGVSHRGAPCGELLPCAHSQWISEGPEGRRAVWLWPRHVNMGYPCPSSCDATTVTGRHLAVYLHYSCGSVNPVVPRWSSAVAVMYLLARGSRVFYSASITSWFRLWEG